MIEGPSGGPTPAPRRPTPNAWIERVAAWLRSIPGRVRTMRTPAMPSTGRTDLFLWRLRLVNRGFWVLLGGLTVYLVLDLLVFKPNPPMLLLHALPDGHETPAVSAFAVEDRLKPLADYQEALALRNPFQLARGEVTPPRAPDAAVSPLSKLTGTLSVVGMNRGGTPEALVEDTQAKRTYFVKVGDQLNGMTVVSIDPQGVTVRYEGEEAIIP